MHIPILYHIQGRRPGRKIKQRYAFREMIDIDLKSVSGAEAPLAASWGNQLGRMERETLDPDVHADIFGMDGLQRSRWYDGSHWLEVTEGYAGTRRSRGPSEAVTATSLERDIALGKRNDVLMIPLIDRVGAKFSSGDQSHLFEYIASSNRDETIARTRNNAENNILLIDDVLHVRCEEPCLRLAPAALSCPNNFVVMVDVHAKPLQSRIGSTAHHRLLPIDMFDTAAEMAVRDCASPSMELLDRNRPTIHHEDAFTPENAMARRLDFLLAEFFNANLETFLKTADARFSNFMYQRGTTHLMRKADFDGILGELRAFIDESAVRFKLDFAHMEEAIALLETATITVPGNRLPGP